MGFKLKPTPPWYNPTDMSIPVYRRNIQDGAVGKSNHTGIIVQEGIHPEDEKAVIAHETVHQLDPDLDYDDDNFYYKGKTYPREKLNEFNRELPWEKKAYAESDKILKEKENQTNMDKFKMGEHRGNAKPFAAMSDRGLIGSTDGASLPATNIKPKQQTERENKFSTLVEAKQNKEQHNKVDFKGLGIKGVSDLSSAVKYRDQQKKSNPKGWREANKNLQSSINTAMSKASGSKSSGDKPVKPIAIDEVKEKAVNKRPKGWASNAIRESEGMDAQTGINYLAMKARASNKAGNTTNTDMVINKISELRKNNPKAYFDSQEASSYYKSMYKP